MPTISFVSRICIILWAILSAWTTAIILWTKLWATLSAKAILCTNAVRLVHRGVGRVVAIAGMKFRPVACATATAQGVSGGYKTLRGFTLLELLMVLVLAGVLLVMGVPSFQGSLQRNRLQNAVRDSATNLSLARVEAITRVRPVALCASVDLATCSGSAWETGALIFVDDGAGAGAALDGQIGGGEELLRIIDPAPDAVTIRTVSFPNTQAIVFLDDGRVQRGIGGTVIVCDDRGPISARGLVVEATGSVRVTRDPSPENGVEDTHLDGVGNALVCP